MKINQVEQTVGITKKNIRFYEQEGLLKPSRIANGYRDYSPEDLDILCKIKLLRKLDIPIEEIKHLQAGDLTLQDCLHRHLIALKRRQSNLEATIAFCRKLLDNGSDLKSMDAEQLLQEMKQQEEGGVRFVDIRKGDKQRQKKNASVAAAIAILFMLPGIAVPIWIRAIDPDMPLWLTVLLVLLASVFIAGVLFALRERLKEIEGGELDEAVKY